MKKKKNEKIHGESNPISPAKDGKRTYFKQADFPQMDLQQAQKIASSIVDNFAAKEASPPDIALALAISPTSSAWPLLRVVQWLTV